MNESMASLAAMTVALALALPAGHAGAEPIPDRTVVLTLDDGVKSHLTFVAPLLERYGFGATFFITRLWRDDPEHFLTWDEVGELHRRGFEIGNHSWTHPSFSEPKVAARMDGELALVEYKLRKVNVPKPVSFAWTGNAFGPQALEALRRSGYLFARRGMQPEVPYGTNAAGPLYDALQNHQLLIPSSGDAYPGLTLDIFRSVVDRAKNGKIAVLQFHGVPDPVHPWVDTPPDRFEAFMNYLKENHFNVIAMRDLAKYVDNEMEVDDPMASVTFPESKDKEPELPVEMVQTRADMGFWLRNMIEYHSYSFDEASLVTGYDVARLHSLMGAVETEDKDEGDHSRVLVLPYPGGRHPRIGFLDGAVDPQRGTKASLFPPWDRRSYAVIDFPEAIFSNLGLTYLAHTHIPTIWDDAGQIIENIDWTRHSDGRLTLERTLPNNIKFGSEVVANATGADLTLWLENGTNAPLTGLRTQVCIMLKAMTGFAELTNDNKTYGETVACAHSSDGRRHLLVAFEKTGRTWGNPLCPCLHADPVLPDAAPGQRVQVKGRVWFYDGSDVSVEIATAEAKWK